MYLLGIQIPIVALRKTPYGNSIVPPIVSRRHPEIAQAKELLLRLAPAPKKSKGLLHLTGRSSVDPSTSHVHDTAQALGVTDRFLRLQLAGSNSSFDALLRSTLLSLSARADA